MWLPPPLAQAFRCPRSGCSPGLLDGNMRAKLKWFIIAAVFLILIGPALLAANFILTQIKLNSLRRADHSRILAACREAIEHRGSYRNDNAQWGFAYRERVVILPPLPSELPSAIREPHPKDVIIDNDRILVNLSLPLSRIGILGYKFGAPQSGTSKYIDGLWFWNGTVGTNSAGNERVSSRSNSSTERPRASRSAGDKIVSLWRLPGAAHADC